QDTIELGLAPEGARSFESGFMNRLASALGATRSIAFSNRMPLAFRGAAPVANVAIAAPKPKPPAVDARQSALIAEMYSGTPLGRGLSAFAEGMGDAWRETVVVVLSEFGRTFRENGNRGTDHGHGSVYWVLGGSVRGGRVAGEQVRVSAATLHQERDYPVLNDYRSLLAGLASRFYGLDAVRLAAVFSGAPPVEHGLL